MQVWNGAGHGNYSPRPAISSRAYGQRGGTLQPSPGSHAAQRCWVTRALGTEAQDKLFVNLSHWQGTKREVCFKACGLTPETIHAFCILIDLGVYAPVCLQNIYRNTSTRARFNVCVYTHTPLWLRAARLTDAQKCEVLPRVLQTAGCRDVLDSYQDFRRDRLFSPALRDATEEHVSSNYLLSPGRTSYIYLSETSQT